MTFNPQPKPVKKEKKKQSFLKPKSKKQSADDTKYNREAKEWLRCKFCAVTHFPAEQVHHKKGRRGYADKYAFENDIKLIHDRRFWLPVTAYVHAKIERNPEWAMKLGYTLTRTDIISK